MENFSAYIPTDLRFGKGCAGEIGVIARQYGKKALLIYGKGSVKKNGAYDTVVNSLKSAGISILSLFFARSKSLEVKMGTDDSPHVPSYAPPIPASRNPPPASRPLSTRSTP